MAKILEIERVKTKTFNGYLLSDQITNILMSMEDAQIFYEELKEEFLTVKKYTKYLKYSIAKGCGIKKRKLFGRKK